MCGRYAFYQRPSEVRRQLEEAHMPSEDCPGDEECRQTYNFAPGSFGIVYRADVPDYGAGPRKSKQEHGQPNDEDMKMEEQNTPALDQVPSSQHSSETHYKLQAMKWGLIPSWTKRNPDYSSMLRTINCRDDSLMENRGMWNGVKRRKRCIVICQGFYEWLKKNNGKDRIPHFIKRTDGQLMCFAGLWDCVRYEGSDEKHYTYTIITTDSNKQLEFLHDRMPVIFDSGSEQIYTWLDPNKYEWTGELQSMLKPFEGELECYPVNKDVGKVGNNSPSFIIPIDSAENKSNIANFFGNQRRAAKGRIAKQNIIKAEQCADTKGFEIEHEPDETRPTSDAQISESNAPMPSSPRGLKREHGRDDRSDFTASPSEHKTRKLSPGIARSPLKPARKVKSATSNGSGSKSSPTKAAQGTQKITKFFGK